MVFVVLRRSSAARAAHREQARSYICFGPIIPGADAHAPLALTSKSWGTNRAVARRHSIASKLAPTFVSGQLFLGQTRASPWRSPRNRGEQTGRSRAQAQAILARNKCRSELARDAPRGRRSIYQALNLFRRTSRNSTHFQRLQKSPPKRASCGTAINQSSRPMMPNNCSRLTNRL